MRKDFEVRPDRRARHCQPCPSPFPHVTCFRADARAAVKPRQCEGYRILVRRVWLAVLPIHNFLSIRRRASSPCGTPQRKAGHLRCLVALTSGDLSDHAERSDCPPQSGHRYSTRRRSPSRNKRPIAVGSPARGSISQAIVRRSPQSAQTRPQQCQRMTFAGS